MSDDKPPSAPAVERRRFLKTAVAAGAAGTLAPAALDATQGPAGTGSATRAAAGPAQASREAVGAVLAQVPQEPSPPLVPLGNSEPPVLHFQACPGGTGALYERLWREHGARAFERETIAVDSWSGPAPATEEELAFLPAHRLGALIRAREVSPVDVAEVYLERLKRYDPTLLCAVTILEGRAREEAQQAEADMRVGDWRGPLHGVPYGIKDLFAVAGTRTTWGAADFSSRLTREDSEIAIRLRRAGAVLLAKLATGEFALGDRWYRGRTLNPWNLEEGSSGSSAGPGSATAAACVAFAIGTETQGSIVSPSRRCGLTALRPTFGRVSRHGGMVLAWSMDKVGPMCRSALDCALVFNAVHGADEKDPGSLTTPFRFDPSLDLSSLRIGHDEDAPEEFLDQLRSLGADPRPMPALPDGRSNALAVESAAAFDFHVAKEGEPAPLPEGLSPSERRRRGRFRSGRETSALDFVQSQRRRLILMRRMDEAMRDFDMFASGSGLVRLTNQTGHPAVVVPYGFGVRNPEADSPTEMPLTTTLIGRLFEDDKLLGVAHALQGASDWHSRRPPSAAGAP